MATEQEAFRRQVLASGALPSGVTVPAAASAVLCALAHRLGRAEAEDLVAGLPQDVRALLPLCATHRDAWTESLDLDGFLDWVNGHFGCPSQDPCALARAVIAAVMRHHGWPGEVEETLDHLPGTLDGLRLAQG